MKKSTLPLRLDSVGKKNTYAYDGKEIDGILKEFHTYYTDNVSSPIEDPDPSSRYDQLRVSGFPYCGLRHLYKRLLNVPREPTTFGSKFYLGTGTLTHRYIQYTLGYGGRILGKWKCLNPKCSGKRTLSRRNPCPLCKSAMDYEELTVRYGRHASGHLDGVYKSKNGRYYLIDYKTSSVKVIKGNEKTKKLPYTNNVAQIKAYCALIELVLDIKISGWLLVYVARDNPMKTVLCVGENIKDKEKATILEKIRNYNRQYDRVMFTKKKEDLNYLVENKPCKTRADYINEYHSVFAPCPLSINNVCFKKNNLEKALEDAWAARKAGWNEVNRPPYLKKLKPLKL